jgi:hypothetical protein
MVSGQVTPDKYVYDKISHQQTSNVLQRQLQWCQGPGEELTVIAPELQLQAKLNDAERNELLKLVMSIAQHSCTAGVDIEWAKVQGLFYMLQCRPITTTAQGMIHTPSLKSPTQFEFWFAEDEKLWRNESTMWCHSGLPPPHADVLNFLEYQDKTAFMVCKGGKFSEYFVLQSEARRMAGKRTELLDYDFVDKYLVGLVLNCGFAPVTSCLPAGCSYSGRGGAAGDL